MYKIHADNTLIYDSTLEDYKIGKGTISLEVDKSGTFAFSVYPDHFFYDDFVKLKTLITVHRSNKILFRGRILNDVIDYWNNKAITCEGELGFFNDSIIRPFTFKGTEAELLRKFVDEHNANVDEFKRFKVGKVTVPNNIVEYDNTNYESAFKNLTTYLTRGHFVITHGEDGTDPIPTLNYLLEFTKVSSQKVEFGSNLKNYTKTAKAEDIATAIIPLATVDGETITIESVNDDVDYVYSEEAVALYGWVFKVVNFDGVTNASDLKTKAEEYIKDVVNQNITVDLNAIDLHLLDKSIESFNIGDYIRVTSEPHNFDATLLCNKQTIDLLKPENDSLVLGYLPSTLTGTTSQVATKVEKVEEEIEQVEEKLENLKENPEINGDNRYFKIEDLSESSAQIGLYGFAEGDDVRIFLRLTNEVDGLYDEYHTIDANSISDGVYTVDFTGLPSDTDFAVNVKYGENWLGAQTLKTRGGAPCFEIEEITETSAKLALYNFAENDEVRVFLRLNDEVDGLYDEVHSLDDNKNTITFTGLPTDTDFAVNIKNKDNWLGAQTFRTKGGSRSFEIETITDNSATIALYNFVESDEVRVFLRLNNDVDGVYDETHTIDAESVADNKYTINFTGLPSNTDFAVNVKYGDNWLGAQTFKTTGVGPYFELTEITETTAEITLYNFPIGDDVRVYVRLPKSLTGIERWVTINKAKFTVNFTELRPNTDFIVNIKYGDNWLGAQTFKTTGASPYFKLTELGDTSAEITFYNGVVGDQITVSIRLPGYLSGFENAYMVTDDEFTIGLNGLRPNTDFIVNIYHEGKWLGEQMFRTTGGEPYFEITSLTKNSAKITIYNTPPNEVVRVILRLTSDITKEYDETFTFDDAENTLTFSGLSSSTDFSVNVQIKGKWLGAQTFRTKSS